MNPSQEPAQPQQPEQPLADPTAEPSYIGGSPDGAAGRSEVSGPGALEDFGGGIGGAGFGLAHPSGPDPYALAGEDYPQGYDDPRRERRPWRRTALVGVLSGVVAFALGGPLGLLWAWLAPSVPVLDVGRSGIVVNDPSPEEYIAADGWYTLLGLGFGLLVAIVAWQVLRRDRGPFLLLGVVLGTLGAGYLAGPWVGELIGKSAYQHWQATAVQGATYLAPPEVHSVGPRLVPAFAAAIVLTLLAGWSNDPDLDEPGAKPGYGPNTAAEEAGDLARGDLTAAGSWEGPAAGSREDPR